jgi:hypothetical protein
VPAAGLVVVEEKSNAGEDENLEIDWDVKNYVQWATMQIQGLSSNSTLVIEEGLCKLPGADRVGYFRGGGEDHGNEVGLVETW